MKKISCVVLLLFQISFAWAQNQTWRIDQSNISFKIKNAGFTVNGNFGGLSGLIDFDPAKGAGNKMEVSIDAGTINTDNNLRDAHLKKEEYFSVDKFPKISMHASDFKKEADGDFTALFTLVLKGTSAKVPLRFRFTEKDGKAKFTGAFEINRLDYKIGLSSFILSDDVTITIELSCSKK